MNLQFLCRQQSKAKFVLFIYKYIFVIMHQHYRQKSPNKSNNYLFELIDGCKHITGQDKLYLRNIIKQYPQRAKQMLAFFQQSGKPVKKLKFYERQFRQAEVKLRKYVNILKKDLNRQIQLKSKENTKVSKQKSISPCHINSSTTKSNQNIVQSTLSLVRNNSNKNNFDKNTKSWRLQKIPTNQQFKLESQHKNKGIYAKKKNGCISNNMGNRLYADSNLSRKVGIELSYDKTCDRVHSQQRFSQQKQKRTNYECIEKALNLQESRKRYNPIKNDTFKETSDCLTFCAEPLQQKFAQSEKIIQKMLLQSQRLVQDYQISKNSAESLKVQQISSSIKQIMTQPYAAFNNDPESLNYFKNSVKYDISSSYGPLSTLCVPSSVSIQASPFKKEEVINVDIFTPVDLLEQCRRIINKSRIKEQQSIVNTIVSQIEQNQSSRVATTFIDNFNSKSNRSMVDKNSLQQYNYTTFGKKQKCQQKQTHSPFLEIQLKNSIQNSYKQSQYTVQSILKQIFFTAKSHALPKQQYQNIMFSLPVRVKSYLLDYKLDKYTIDLLGHKLQQSFTHQPSIARDLLNVIDLQTEKQKTLSLKSIESFVRKMSEACAPNISEIEQSLWKLYYNTKNQFDIENLGYYSLLYMEIKQQRTLLELCSALEEYQFEIEPAYN